MKDEKHVVLLDDLPAMEDAFGGHARIAQCIQDLVTTERGGKAIALVGSWGGGKSTVINLLQVLNQKRHDHDIGLFIFDAWAHEGDPLRRTFLERFVEFLEEKGWIGKEKWNEKLAELSRRLVKSETETTPKLTKAGVWAGVALLFGTLGLAMISAGMANVWWNACGFVFTAAPFAVLVHGLVTAKWRSSDDVLRYFVNKQREKVMTTTLETPEPTSVEFHAWFRELAAEALQANRKILLVIDNLDRVDPEDALKLWSAMRTFVDLSGVNSPEWMSKLWVLAAFDETGIERLWKHSDGKGLATTFLDKTFQIRFRIPSPLLSDWRDFLGKQLKKAFPKANDEDAYKVSRIYAILKADQKPPTPRDMKVFVNQIGAIYRTAPEDIPLAHMALYAALISSDWHPTKEMPSKEHLYAHLDTDVEEDLAALFFGMPQEKAVQVRFGEHVEKAITEGNPEMLVTHSGKKWLGDVIDQVVSRRLPEWLKNEPQLIGRAAFTLLANEDIATKVSPHTYLRLIAELQKVEAWPKMDRFAGEGIAGLIKGHPENDLAERVVTAISNTSFEGESKGGQESDTLKDKNWTAGIVAVLKILHTQSHKSLKHFTVCTAPEKYVSVLAAVRSECPEYLWKYFHPGCTERSVIDYVNQILNSGKGSATHEHALEVMIEIPCDWAWGELSAIKAKLQTQQLAPEEIGRNLRILWRVRNTTAGHFIPDLIQSGWVFHQLYTAKNSNNNDAIGAAVLLATVAGTDTTATNSPQAQSGRSNWRTIVTQPDQNKQITEVFAGLIRQSGGVETVLKKRTDNSPAKPMLDAVLRQLAQTDACEVIFSSEAVVEFYQTLKMSLDPVTLENLLNSSLERGALEAQLLKVKLDRSNAGLFKFALEKRRTPDVVAAATEQLKVINKDEWSASLKIADDLVPVIIDLVNWKVNLGLSVPLQDALSAFADGILANGDIPAHITSEVCNVLITSLTEEQQRTFKRGLLNKVISCDASTAKVLTLFQTALMDCEVLKSKADDLVQVGFRRMLDRKRFEELQWIKNVLAECPRFCAACQDYVLQDFQERVEMLDKKSLNDECLKALNGIEALLKQFSPVASSKPV